jgi:type II secretory pathway component PulF
MYWNVTSLTRMGSIVNQTLKGERQEVLTQVKLHDLDIISIHPDYKQYFENVFKKGKLSGCVLSSFFKDFSRGLKAGLSAQEAITFLNEQTTDPLLKETLRKLNVSIIDGHSLKDAFENTKVFPLIALNVLDAAERSGNFMEVTLILSEYFKFMNDNKIRIIKSLIYPACVFIALTAASIVISIKLVPQLGAIIPAQAGENLSTRFIIGYAAFMRSYWWVVFIVLITAVLALIKIWEYKKIELMKYALKLPLLGNLIKEMELTFLFLNLYVYQKSGVNIIASMTNVYSNHPNYVTHRLVDIKNKVNQGRTLGDAIKSDEFFPSLVAMNIKKGETTGDLYQYFYEIYRYYDQRSRDSIETLITYINPALLTIAVSYLGLIISCFILPLYSSMSGTGTGFNK